MQNAVRKGGYPDDAERPCRNFTEPLLWLLRPEAINICSESEGLRSDFYLPAI
ncbi:hypothetical protein LMG28138_05695 [Pararobbsia alpina]|uniref:Uncharacterized protein n=1 Tax=Pararobbsia alpina TaxID=621374 RepID=A0A6S7BMD5_9BURK|nr:hypothetical protein LMG28138_05695 [Pararobbsia alpina]